MVPHPRTPRRADRVSGSKFLVSSSKTAAPEAGTPRLEPGTWNLELRPLNVPVPVAVETGAAGEPAFVTWRGRRLAVAAVADRWRIDDEWWRTPISRLYRRLVLADDRVLTVFEDLIGGGWYVQRYRFGKGTQAGVWETRKRRRKS